ncbi:PorP/SprF family type IX secretion system membrane protein [Pontibacter sp. KCTC 32443]|uniref:PorP/SprF family type IX secretion system membrane protein n=1 Tax=Pontibacter TaxID=323449 RepID=UPI00164E8A9C|nr:MULTISPECIES: PorP/SprF family type IX secretion system membrane protein [Pontibacter]MBC5774590.1 PorP/SprF family type IX secretion system membrane protein [Pontibacter sp. KCTC 32443]
MFLKKWILYVIAFLWCFVATAQDVHYSQQYANRLYLNPAFAGLNHDWSVSISHRTQWPALNGAFLTNQVAADLLLPNTKSAISLLLLQDKAGIGGLQKLAASAGYAYHTPLTDRIALSAGLQATVASLSINFDNLVFGDQLSDNGQVAVTTAEANTFEPTQYISFATGALLYTNQLWLGLTAAHLNKPAYGFGEKTSLPMRFTVNTGYKFYVSSYQTNGGEAEFSITPTATFTHQKNFNWLSAGLYTNYTPVSLGLLYKGVPVTGDQNQEQALAVIAGLQLNQVKVGFSHDVGISDFSRQSGGATEISIVFERLGTDKVFRSRSRSKISRRIICPEI